MSVDYEDMIGMLDDMIEGGNQGEMHTQVADLVWWNNARLRLQQARQCVMNLLIVEEKHAILEATGVVVPSYRVMLDLEERLAS